MKKLSAIPFAPITWLKDKVPFLRSGGDEQSFNNDSSTNGAEPRFCETGALCLTAARERVTSLQRLIPPIKQREKANRTFATGIRHGVFGGLGKPQQKPAKGPLAGTVPFVLITLLSAANAEAAWIDDYFGSAVTTNPSAAESQKRGYYTAGGFTARVPHRKEPLMTVSLPSIKTGCGGIDTFWGGISFMNADYMVKKAEGVLKAAPYVVFSLGLKALSTQFGDTIEAVQAIVDQLNNLQLDECAAAKGLVTMAVDMSQGKQPAIVGEFERLKSTATNLVDGVGKSWDKMAKQTDKDPRLQKAGVVARKITDPKAREFLTGTGYVLDKLSGDDWKLITKSEADAIRALVGDVFYDNAQKEPVYSYKTGCAAGLRFDDYIFLPTPSQTSAQLSAGTTVCATAGDSIMDKTVNILERLRSGYTDNSSRTVSFDPAILEFLNRADLPVMAYFSTASMAGNEYLAASVPVLSTAVASGYAYGSLMNLSAVVSKVTGSLRNEMAEQKTLTEGFTAVMDEYNQAIRSRMASFEKEYDLTLSRINTLFEFSRRTQSAAMEIEKIKADSFLSGGSGN